MYLDRAGKGKKTKQNKHDLSESGSMNDFPSHLKMFPIVKNCLCNTYNYKAIKWKETLSYRGIS